MIFHQQIPASLANLPGRVVRAPDMRPEAQSAHEKRLQQMREYAARARAKKSANKVRLLKLHGPTVKRLREQGLPFKAIAAHCGISLTRAWEIWQEVGR